MYRRESVSVDGHICEKDKIIFAAMDGCLILSAFLSVTRMSCRWMTAPDSMGKDPIQWRLEATNDIDASEWVSLHEMSSSVNAPYSIPAQTTFSGAVFYARQTWTKKFDGR